MNENMIFKEHDGIMSVDIHNDEIEVTKSVVRSFDYDTCKFTYKLTKNGVPLSLSGASKVNVTLKFGNEAKAVLDATTVDSIESIISFVYPEQYLGYSGRVLGEVSIQYENGQTLVAGYFSFVSKGSYIDEAGKEIPQFYWERFEDAEGLAKETIELIEKNKVVKDSDFQEAIGKTADKKEVEEVKKEVETLKKEVDTKATKQETDNKLEKKTDNETFLAITADMQRQIESTQSGMIGEYDSEAQLKAEYPQGAKGYAVVWLNENGEKVGYTYTYKNGSWVKGNVWNGVGIPNDSIGKEKLKQKSVSKEKIAFSPYTKINYKKANFNVDNICDFDDFGNLTFIKDSNEQIDHNYKIYADLIGVGGAVKVSSKHLISTDSTRIFIGINDSSMIFANLRAHEGNIIIEYHSVERNTVKTQVFPTLFKVGTGELLYDTHTITLRQIGYYVAVYFNDTLVHYLNSKTYFCTQFTSAGASFRGSVRGNSHIRTIDSEREVSAYMHFSIDDVNSILKDINDNRDTYSSIFDNKNLAFLKKMNEKYGAVFSLYLFKESSTFDISNMTTKFRVEFAENSNWLKFGFHSKNAEKNYLKTTTQEAVEDYTAVVDAIYKFAVSNTLDTIPRFHNFGVSLDCQKAIISAGLPFEGTYGADDKRELSAGLSGYPLTIIQNTDYYFDPKLQLLYPHSEYRMDQADEETILKQLDNLSRDVCNNKIYGLFWHQGAELRLDQQKAIEAACKWAINHQIRFDFPQNNKPTL